MSLVGPVVQPHKEEVGTSGSGYEVHCRHCSPPQTLIRSEGVGCSGTAPRHLTRRRLHGRLYTAAMYLCNLAIRDSGVSSLADGRSNRYIILV